MQSLQMDEKHPFDSVIVYWEWEDYGSSKTVPYEYHASVLATWYQYILGIKWFAKYISRRVSTDRKKYLMSSEDSFLLDYVQYYVK